MSDMEHMNERWGIVEDGGRYYIQCDTGMNWYVCEAAPDLPQDDDGKRTLQTICDEHNAALDERHKKAAPPHTPRQDLIYAAHKYAMSEHPVDSVQRAKLFGTLCLFICDVYGVNNA